MARGRRWLAGIALAVVHAAAWRTIKLSYELNVTLASVGEGVRRGSAPGKGTGVFNYRTAPRSLRLLLALRRTGNASGNIQQRAVLVRLAPSRHPALASVPVRSSRPRSHRRRRCVDSQALHPTPAPPHPAPYA